jgi:hypothetical protein
MDMEIQRDWMRAVAAFMLDGMKNIPRKSLFRGNPVFK